MEQRRVPLLDAHIIVPPTDVEFCEVSSSLDLVHDVGDERKRIPVLDGDRVESTVILNRTKRAIPPFDEKEW
jgi:hypothetical protein